MLSRGLQWPVVLLINSLVSGIYAVNPISRWGQAAVVINDALYIFGGKTDEFNSYSYTSAPNTNDLLYLSLASPFNVSSPPWTSVGGSSNASAPQGPPLAWQTLSAFNSSRVLLFGGQPDANSDIVLVNRPDSASLLDVWNRLTPQWLSEPSSWANEPPRRIHHSTATLPSGVVLIFGGEKADGSKTCLSDSWVFNPNTASFSPLPAENSPPDLCGHVSVPLPDGRVLVFGGYSPSQGILLLFSTIYVLDTNKDSFKWSRLEVSGGGLPTPRRAFAAALIAPDKILIQGGSDAEMQTNLDDGWVLDVSRTPATWTRVPTLTSVGSRRDHFAICSGDQVVFGFGYGTSGPAPAPLQVYDVGGDKFVSSFVPSSPSASATRTLAPATQTVKPGKTHGMEPSTGQPSPTGTDRPNGSAQSSKSKTIAIAVGTTLGLVAISSFILLVIWYRRRKQKKWEARRFWVIDEDDVQPLDGTNPADNHRQIPRAGPHEEQQSETGHGLHIGILNTLGLNSIAQGLTTKTQNPEQTRDRRNMLDDEDAHDFGAWYETKGKEGTGGSSWSLKNILGGLRSHEPSVGGHSATSSTPWREKPDPFSDGTAPVRDEEVSFLEVAALRPHSRRDSSYVSTRSGLSYTDPFSDPLQEEPREPSNTAYQAQESPAIRLIPPRPSLPLPGLITSLPVERGGHALSPLTERASQSTLPLEDNLSGSSRAPSNEHLNSPFSTLGSRNTSLTSHIETPHSPTLLSSLLPATDSSLKRSGSWWSRMARKASDASSRSGAYHKIRDPNPPPKLVTIDEGTRSSTPERSVPQTRQPSEEAQLYGGKHGKSMSSFRTMDSEAIERMAGTMEVVQRATSHSRQDRTSIGSAGDQLSIDTQISDERGGDSWGDVTFASPADMTPNESGALGAGASRSHSPAPQPPASAPPWSRSWSGAPSSSRNPPPSAPSGAVASRVQAFERRTTYDPSGGPALGSKQRVERPVTVDYGLIPRRSLFIANPDRRLSQSSSES